LFFNLYKKGLSGFGSDETETLCCVEAVLLLVMDDVCFLPEVVLVLLEAVLEFDEDKTVWLVLSTSDCTSIIEGVRG